MTTRPEYDMETVGKNLRRLRVEKGYSVKQVQEYLCLGSPQAVYKYEGGKGYPQADTLLALMELYHASIRDISVPYEMQALTGEHGLAAIKQNVREEDDRSSSFWFIYKKRRQKPSFFVETTGLEPMTFWL